MDELFICTEIISYIHDLDCINALLLTSKDIRQETFNRVKYILTGNNLISIKLASKFKVLEICIPGIIVNLNSYWDLLPPNLSYSNFVFEKNINDGFVLTSGINIDWTIDKETNHKYYWVGKNIWKVELLKN